MTTRLINCEFDKIIQEFSCEIEKQPIGQTFRKIMQLQECKLQLRVTNKITVKVLYKQTNMQIEKQTNRQIDNQNQSESVK